MVHDGHDSRHALVDAIASLDRREPGGFAPLFDPVTWCRRLDPAADIAGMALARAPAQPVAPMPPEAATVASEHLHAALARIARLQPRLQAFLLVDAEGARRALRALRGDEPLGGVLIAHKDILWTAGLTTTAGSALLRDHVPAEDATVVTRLREAGAISLGKLATHEFATGVTGTVSAFATPRNPWGEDRVPGGSSSGSAVAVAAGLVTLATATDTGGSIRIPAACCGVVGLKPTYGFVPTHGVIPFSWSLDHVGVIARTIADVTRAYRVMAASPPAAIAPRGAIRFAVAEAMLRLCREDVAEAVRAQAAHLERSGHVRVRTGLPDQLLEAAPVAAAIFLAEGAALHREALRRWPGEYRPETVALLELAEHVSGTRYVQAQRLRARLGDAMAELMRSVDVLVCPALPVTAPRIHEDAVELPGGAMDTRAALTLFTRPFNLTGQPALVLPCGCGADGLPVAAQLVGRPGEEERLLAVGAELEAAEGCRWPPGLEPDRV